MQVPFTKMNSQGNDFIVIDNTNIHYQFSNTQIKGMCSRGTIGCDQLLILNVEDENNINCDIFNKDGSTAKQCGNGLRAIMLFLNREYGFTSCAIFVNLIPYYATYISQEKIQVNMGYATFTEDIPTLVSPCNKITKDSFFYNVVVNDETSSWSFLYVHLSIGNPHCIVFSEDSFFYKDKISNFLNSIYQEGVNISFILNLDEFLKETKAALELRVNERGAGWTKSCGSGATATGAFILRLISLPKYGPKNISSVKIRQEGGELYVEHIKNNTPNSFNKLQLTLCGPSVFEYDGIWND